MNINQLIDKIKDRFSDVDLSTYDGFLALQFNITSDPSGVLYIEIKDHAVSVMPYEYYDRQASMTITAIDLLLVLDKRLDPLIAFTSGRLHIDGDPAKVLELSKILTEYVSD